MKSAEVKQLETDFYTLHYQRHPSVPEYARFKRKFEDKTANGLTNCIITFLTIRGHQAERISTTGRFVDNRTTFADVCGFSHTIGRGRWIKGNTTKGSADISATINGRSVKIEVKIGRDRQSEDQKQYQHDIEQAGGLYFIAKDLTMFAQWYNETFKTRGV